MKLRCPLCARPMQDTGAATLYCSDRCLLWDEFGIPPLARRSLLKERMKHLRGGAGNSEQPSALPPQTSDIEHVRHYLARAVLWLRRARKYEPKTKTHA